MESPIARYFRFKLLIFFLFVLGALLALLGPFLFPNVYFRICAAVLAYYFLKFFVMALIMIHNYAKFTKNLQQGEIMAGQAFSTSTIHVFIIPNFKEDIGILRQTVGFLAKHPNAAGYCVFLAMEKHEQGCQEKAEQILSQFKNSFKILSYTLHELQAGEAKSKNSNINWCGQHMVPTLLENEISLDQVFITIMDADSLIPSLYADQISKYVEEHAEEKHLLVFEPPQIFTRNASEVPFFIRAIDTMMSYMHFSNLFSFFNYTMAVSNYTLSYRLLERIDFWDTCEYSRGEDVRTSAKAYWKTDGKVKVIPIYVPANQFSISTGRGYKADFLARFHQAKRHCQCQIEVSYNLVSLLERRFTIRNFHVFYSIFEVYMMVIVIPLPLMILGLQDGLRILPHAPIDSGFVFLLFNACHLPALILGFIFYELIRRKATTELFGVKNMNILYTVTYPFLGTIFATFFGTIPMVLAGISLFNNKIIYTVAPKNISNKDEEPPAFKPSLQMESETMPNPEDPQLRESLTV